MGWSRLNAYAMNRRMGDAARVCLLFTHCDVSPGICMTMMILLHKFAVDENTANDDTVVDICFIRASYSSPMTASYKEIRPSTKCQRQNHREGIFSFEKLD